MIGYQDRTFCNAKECRNFPTCERALTEKVLQAAEKWWKGPGAPISLFADPKELKCYDHIPQEGTGSPSH